MMLNWVAHVKQLGVPYLVVALDTKVARLCEKEDVFYLLHDSQVGKGCALVVSSPWSGKLHLETYIWRAR